MRRNKHTPKRQSDARIAANWSQHKATERYAGGWDDWRAITGSPGAS